METSRPPVLGKETLLITIRRALEIVLANVRPMKTTGVLLDQALGRRLAGDILADRDLPPTDRSAMDGYAVRAKDLRRCPRELRLVGEVAAGSPRRPKVAPGTCVTILTGASIPPGSDAVVKVEETEERDGLVNFLATTKVGANIRVRGEEVKKHEVVLPKGTVLNAAQIGLCASVGKATVRVYGRPGVAVLCTGRELHQPGARVGPHHLRDSNGPALRAALKNAGIDEIAHQIVPDDPKTLTAKLKAAVARYELVILTGGVSVGKYDFVPEAVRRIGARVRFHRIAMKPGMPQLYATLSGNRHIFGLPGNPLSVLTGFYELVVPAIRRMSGLSPASCSPALRLPLAREVRCKKANRTTYVLGKLTWSGNGACVSPLKSHGSADLVAGAQADGVLAVPRNVGEISAGELVEFTPWRPIP